MNCDQYFMHPKSGELNNKNAFFFCFVFRMQTITAHPKLIWNSKGEGKRKLRGDGVTGRRVKTWKYGNGNASICFGNKGVQNPINLSPFVRVQSISWNILRHVSLVNRRFVSVSLLNMSAPFSPPFFFFFCYLLFVHLLLLPQKQRVVIYFFFLFFLFFSTKPEKERKKGEKEGEMKILAIK